MTASNPFQLSRIYSMGWSAARTKLAAGETLEEAQAVGLSPYANDPEQNRWVEGFRAGLRGWRGRSPSATRFGGKR